ncbi:hypothetical protein [Treponema sp.]|uniref:hypothetical protein n=1 Tax=Treponema sp. TaxID=166 RepID=UPI00298DF8BA|nr:hypothetical protein [Treponema sp.]MCQ2242510.1 hypothetical protein [Treponema sp.]
MLPSSAYTLLPSIILTSLFIFFSKDEMEYKINSTVPLLGMFYAVFIPYLTLTSGEKDSFFMIFFNPILFMETIILLHCAVKRGTSSFLCGDKKKAIISVLAVVLVAMLQPAMFALWYLKFLAPLAYIIPVVMLPISLFVYKFFPKE